MKQATLPRLALIAILIVFALSRVWIYLNPPPYYSDVTADYERYANIWYYGLTPYKEHLYEYPPLSVPLLLMPLILDQNGVGTYYPNYRFQILLIDTIFFIFLLLTVKNRLPWTKRVWIQASLGYIALTTLGKDFLYEGLDLTFTASFLTAILIWSWVSHMHSWKTQVLSWSFFWLSTAIKFLTLPLLVPLALIFSGSWLKRGLTALTGFTLIWGIPLILFGTSLSVSFVYNSARPIKYASFPAYVIEVINSFTQTEEKINLAPDFPWAGPVSETVTDVVAIVFPLAVATVLLWSVIHIFRIQQKGVLNSLVRWVHHVLHTQSQAHKNQLLAVMLNIYGIYIFTLFLFAKTFSQPFHIWYMPLFMVYPFASNRHRLWVFSAGCLLVLLDMTTLLHLDFASMGAAAEQAGLLRSLVRFIPMIGLLLFFVRDTKRIVAQKVPS